MSNTGSKNLKTNLAMIGNILYFHMHQEKNEHATCVLKGMVADGYGDEFARENNNEKRVEIYLEEEFAYERKTIIFAGVIGELSVFHDGASYQFKMILYSPPFLMDLKKKSRSFQDIQITYESLMKKIMGEYDGGDLIDRLSYGKTIGKPIVQYEETDWDFIKRLASHFNGSILPASEFTSPKLFFGAIKEQDIGKLEQFSYQMEKRLDRYREWSAGEYPDYREMDSIQFQIEDRNYYELGCRVNYQGMAFYIGKMDAFLEKGEAIFRYTLYTKNGMGQPYQYAEHIIGVSIQAEVLAVVKDKIKVKLEIDSSQDVETAWEFPYQTLYTAQGQGGWYCMPEKGDLVMIYFPSKKESEAVGTSSSRTGNGGKERKASPEIKFFRTIYGKEIRFTPDSVEIICEDRKTGKKKAHIILHDDDGVEISSMGDITVSSREGIRLEAENEIEIAASERICLHCKKGRIQMDSKIDIAGPDVRIN